MKPCIQIRALTYFYPDAEQPILDALDLEVEAGELLLVAGPSGVGKSSLLRAFNGLIPHFHGGKLSGDLQIGDRDPVELGPRGMSDLVGFVNQDPESQFVASVVEDELAFAMENHGVDPDEMIRRIDEVLARLSIAELRLRRVDTLSGGERQRVAIAGVLTLRPDILVLDEPTSQLDPESSRDVLEALGHLKASGLTLIVSEHRLERIMPYADRVLLLDRDRAPRLGQPSEVLAGSSLAPPILRLGESLGWSETPVTVRGFKGHRAWPALAGHLREALAASDGLDENDGPDTESVGGIDGPEPGDDVALSIRELTLTYGTGQIALAGIDLDVPSGSLVALMGRNGSGKSTLLKCLVGLLKPDRGEIELYPESGETVDPLLMKLSEMSRWVGFVPQNPSRLLFHDTVERELSFGLKSEADIERSVQLTKSLGLEGLESRHPRDLSTGERQRLAVATILLMGPRILLLDEPTRGLDVDAKRRFTEILRSLVDAGTTVLMATHDVEWVAASADRAVLLEDGRVAAVGRLEQVLGWSHADRVRKETSSAAGDDEDPGFVPQMVRLTGDPCCLTVDKVMALLATEKAP